MFKIQVEPDSHLNDKESAQEFPNATRQAPEIQVVPASQNCEFISEQVEPAGIVQMFEIQIEPDSQLVDKASRQEFPIETRHAPDKQEVPATQNPEIRSVHPPNAGILH